MFEFSSSLAVSITSLASHAEIYNKKTNTRQMLKNKQKKNNWEKWLIKIRDKQNAQAFTSATSLTEQKKKKKKGILTDLWRNLPPFLVRGYDIRSLCICITFEPWFRRRWRSLGYIDCDLWRRNQRWKEQLYGYEHILQVKQWF